MAAFYSNYENKQALVLAMLDDHLERSLVHNRALAERNPTSAEFVDALRNDKRRDDPLHVNPELQVELMLFAALTEDSREALGAHLIAIARWSAISP